MSSIVLRVLTIDFTFKDRLRCGSLSRRVLHPGPSEVKINSESTKNICNFKLRIEIYVKVGKSTGVGDGLTNT